MSPIIGLLILIGMCCCFSCLSSSAGTGLWVGVSSSNKDAKFPEGSKPFLSERSCVALPNRRLEGAGFLQSRKQCTQFDNVTDCEKEGGCTWNVVNNTCGESPDGDLIGEYSNISLTQCADKCKKDEECLQYVYGKPRAGENGKCRLFSKEFMKCFETPLYESGKCNDSVPLDNCFKQNPTQQIKRKFMGMDRYCNSQKGRRLYGGGYPVGKKEGGSEAQFVFPIPPESHVSTTACEEACVNHDKCMQYNYDNNAKKCYLYNTDGMVCDDISYFDSGYCGVDPNTNCVVTCPDGQERVPKRTGVCMKICTAGRERNPTTLECVAKCPDKDTPYYVSNVVQAPIKMEYTRNWQETGTKCIPKCGKYKHLDDLTMTYNLSKDRCEVN